MLQFNSFNTLLLQRHPWMSGRLPGDQEADQGLPAAHPPHSGSPKPHHEEQVSALSGY